MKIKNFKLKIIFLLILFFGFLSFATNAYAAEFYWYGNGGNWSDYTNHWSDNSGNSPSSPKVAVPTSSDNCHFDANSFSSGSQTVTLNVSPSCSNVDFTGVTNSPTIDFTSYALNIYGQLTLAPGVKTTGSQSWLFRGASSSLTTGGNTTMAAPFAINSATVSLTLNDAFNMANSSFYLYGGSLNTNNQNITASYIAIQNGFTKNLNWTSSVITLTGGSTYGGWQDTATDTVNNTWGTSSIIITGQGPFTGGGRTYTNVSLNGTSHVISGSNTFTNLIRTGTATKTDTVTFTSGTTQTVTGVLSLIGNSATNRLLVQSSTLGTAATLDVDGAWTNTANADFMDITSTHAVSLSTIDGLSGDAQGNTNITFSATQSHYWVATSGGSWSSTSSWSASSGGGSGIRVPLPQDDVYVDINSITSSSKTITVDMPRIGRSIDFTGLAYSPTVSLSNNIYNYGSYTLVSGMTYTAGNKANLLLGRGSYSLTTAGKTFSNIYFGGPGSIYTLQDDFNFSATQTSHSYYGTLDLNGKNVTGGYFSVENNTTIYLRNGTITLSGADASYGWRAYTGATVYAGGSTIIMTGGDSSGRMFQGGSFTYNNVVASGSGNFALTITGSNTFGTFTVNRSQAAKTITFTSGTTQTVNNFVSATSGTTVTTLTGTGPWTIARSATSSAVFNLDYVNIASSSGTPSSTWYYGQNSTADSYSTSHGWSAVTFRYWVQSGGTGTGTWDASDTTHWATASGAVGGASVPTSATPVRFDVNSFSGASQTVTVGATVSCNDIDWTGATNSPTLAVNNILYAYGQVTFIAAMTENGTNGLYFLGSSAGCQLTTNGLTLSAVTGTSSSFTGTLTLQDNLTAGGQFTHQRGTVNTNSKNITTAAVNITGSTAKTLTLGSSTIAITGSTSGWNYSGSNLTLNANTSKITLINQQAFLGGNLTYYEIQLNGTAHTISGSNYFTNIIRNGTATKTDTVTFTSGTTQTVSGVLSLIGNSVNNRLLVQSDTLGTAATVTVNGAWTNTANADFMDITSTNTTNLSAISGLSGDCGGNSGITFSATQAHYWVATSGGNWSDTSSWSASSGGGSGIRVPLPQDDVYVDINSITSSSKTITADMPRAGRSIDFTGMANSPTISTLASAWSVYGSLTLISNMTFTMGNSIHFRSRTSSTITSAGKNIIYTYFYGYGGTYTIQDDTVLSTAGNYTILSAGTVDFNGKNIAAGRFIYDTSTARALYFHGSTLTLNNQTQTPQWCADSTNYTTDAATSGSIILTETNSYAQSFGGGGLTYNNVVASGSGNFALTITGSNTFGTFTVNRSQAAKTITFTSGTTQTVNNFVSATSGTTVTTLTGTGPWTIARSATSSAVFNLDYVNIASSSGTPSSTWYYGQNSTADSYSTSHGWSAVTFRYWVQSGGTGTGTWDASDTTHWATASGAVGGASVPTSATPVRFDVNSFSGGSQTITVSANVNVLDMDWTGATNSPALTMNANITSYGQVTFISAMSVAGYHWLYWRGSSAGCALTTNGLSLTHMGIGAQDTFTGTLTFQDAVNVDDISWISGTLNTNSKTITLVEYFWMAGSGTKTVTLGSSVINVGAASHSWAYDGSNLTFNAGTSSIRLMGTYPFVGGGLTYYEVQLNGTAHTISGSNTFTNLITPSGTTQTLTFTDGTTQTITNATLSGSSGHIHTLRGSGTGGWAIIKAGGGKVNASYLSLSYSTASPANTWFARNSTDRGNNSGWIFNITIQTSDLQKGLVGNWKFNGNAKDSTAYGNNGTVTGATLTTDRKGQVNKAYSFNGSSNYVVLNSVVSLTGTYSIGFWAYRNNNSTYHMVIGHSSESGKIGFDSGNNKLFVRSYNGGSSTQNGSALSGTWNYILVTRDANNKVDAYINGGTAIRLFGDAAQSGTFNINEIGYDGAGNYFSGSIDDVRIYNRVLTSAEIIALYQEYDPSVQVSDLQKGLVGNWKMNGNAKDSTAYGNNGTVTGATLTTDRKGQANRAYSFNGSNSSYINVGNVSNFSFGASTDFSIGFWIKAVPHDNVSNKEIFGKRYQSTNPGYNGHVDYQTGVVSLSIRDVSGNSVTAASSKAIDDNIWHHVVGVFSRTGNLSVYIDGSLSGTPASIAAVGNSDNTYPLKIGQGAWSQSLNGAIDDFRIYNRVLSPTEVTALYDTY